MNRGGAETMVMNYYRNIDRTKVQFDFLLHRPDRGAYDDEIESLGGRIFRMPAISPRNYFRYKRALKRFFDQHGAQYLIVHSHLNALSYLVLGAAKGIVPTRISHSHTSLNPWSIFRVFSPEADKALVLKSFMYHHIRRRCRRVASDYFACGEKASDWLYGKALRERVTILPNAIDTGLFALDPEKRKQVRKDLGLADALTVVHVGRFDEPKNHHFLIRVFHALLEKDREARLLLIGTGKLQPAIRKAAADKGISEAIRFLGVRSDIPELLMAADVFLFPSLYEGLPVTLVEAQASGLPILASDRVTQEINVTGLVEYLSLETNPDVWAAKILEKRDIRDPSATQGVVDANYDIQANARFLMEYYMNKARE